MKTINIYGSAVALVLGLSACSNSGENRFLNLTTGEGVEIVRNDEGQMIDKKTNKPVLLYVDTEQQDTFYGINGNKVNGRLLKMDDVYYYDMGEDMVKIDGDEYKIENGNTKIKWDADGGEYKYKSDDVTVKKDRDDYKVEKDGYKRKVDEDGDVKLKTDKKKIKIDGETGERKVKERSIFSKVKEKITD